MIIPINFGQVTHIFAGSGVPLGAAVSYGFNNGAGVSALSAANEFHDNWGDNVQPALVQNVDLVQTIVKLGPNEIGASAVASGTRGGADLSAQAAPNVAYLVHKVTAVGGRRGRGRMYLPGVDETVVTQGGNIDPAKVTELNTGLGLFEARATAGNLGLVLLHAPATVWSLVDGQPRRIPDPTDPPVPAPYSITDLVPSGVVATQRRRLRR